MSRQRSGALILALLASMACSTERSGSEALATRVDSLADRFFQVQVELYPELATTFGLVGADHSGLTDNSLTDPPAARAGARGTGPGIRHSRVP